MWSPLGPGADAKPGVADLQSQSPRDGVSPGWLPGSAGDFQGSFGWGVMVTFRDF